MKSTVLNDELIRNLPLDLRAFSDIFQYSTAKHAQRVFMSFEAKDYTYQEFGEQTLSLLAGLKSQGIGKGSVVPIMMVNSAQYVMAWFAVHLSGATMALVNPGLKGRLLDQLLLDCNCSMIFACQEASKNLRDIDFSLLSTTICFNIKYKLYALRN
jgi:acyl-CoA synthetase (AMP-forming)/AMP-acid ligase II